jgi:hypothetical protein
MNMPILPLPAGMSDAGGGRHPRHHGKPVAAVQAENQAEKAPRLMNRTLCRERNVIERLVGRLGVPAHFWAI